MSPVPERGVPPRAAALFAAAAEPDRWWRRRAASVGAQARCGSQVRKCAVSLLCRALAARKPRERTLGAPPRWFNGPPGSRPKQRASRFGAPARISLRTGLEAWMRPSRRKSTAPEIRLSRQRSADFKEDNRHRAAGATGEPASAAHQQGANRGRGRRRSAVAGKPGAQASSRRGWGRSAPPVIPVRGALKKTKSPSVGPSPAGEPGAPAGRPHRRLNCAAMARHPGVWRQVGFPQQR